MIYSPLQKRIPFCHSIYVPKVMKLLAFIFEHTSTYLQLLLYSDKYNVFSLQLNPIYNLHLRAWQSTPTSE